MINGDFKKAFVFDQHEDPLSLFYLPPAEVIRLAISFAPIGTLGLSFLSCLANPKYGRIAIISFADALFAASIINKTLKENQQVEE